MKSQDMRAVMSFIPSKAVWMCRTHKAPINDFLVTHPDPVVAYSEWLKLESGSHPEFQKQH